MILSNSNMTQNLALLRLMRFNAIYWYHSLVAYFLNHPVYKTDKQQTGSQYVTRRLPRIKFPEKKHKNQHSERLLINQFLIFRDTDL